ncbi:MAG: recombinase family protein [Caloramator sp.]|nr:recombinase family protein [Caloramator sp.]
MKHIAIYARKSVEVKDSISIDTQIEMCKNYFFDQKCEFEVFADDGYTGANTDRPAFKRLLKKIQLECFDTVICYKLDRISRRVLDIADFFELLEKKNIDFVCVKDKYDTSTPMGRAMLYFASVFAQLERETIAERVTDSMLNLAKKGCWTGGPAPTGYKLTKHEGKTYIELENPQFIKDCFNWYLQYGSLYAIHKKLKEKYDITPVNRENVRRILRSPLYVKSDIIINDYLKKNNWTVIGEPTKKGYLTYGLKTGEPMAIVSRHDAVIEPLLWLKVQEKLNNKREDFFKKDSKIYWLSGLLICPFCGKHYSIVNSAKNHYYACSSRIKRGNYKTTVNCSNNKYINAIKIEDTLQEYILTCKNYDFFKKIYKSTFLNDTDTNELEIIKNTINKNNKMIENLIDKVALLSNEAGKKILEKIEQLTNENKELNEKIENYKLYNLEMQNLKFNEEYIYENILKFDKTIEPSLKRIIAKNIFKKIIFNPFTNEMEVEFS